MRKKPNRDMNEEQKEAAQEFINGAGKPGDSDQDTEEETLPWQKEKVREDVKQTYPLRLPEPLHLKLKFLAEESGKSMNQICNEAVRGLVGERLEAVLEENR